MHFMLRSLVFFFWTKDCSVMIYILLLDKITINTVRILQTNLQLPDYKCMYLNNCKIENITLGKYWYLIIMKILPFYLCFKKINYTEKYWTIDRKGKILYFKYEIILKFAIINCSAVISNIKHLNIESLSEYENFDRSKILLHNIFYILLMRHR